MERKHRWWRKLHHRRLLRKSFQKRKMDGLYYRHDCPHCNRVTYDCLPMLDCHRCKKPLDDQDVTFDQKKRVSELEQKGNTRDMLKNIANALENMAPPN